MMTNAEYEEWIKETRKKHAQEEHGARQYAICMALDMTRLSIELERLEMLGIPAEITKRWHDRANILLHDILDASRPLKALKAKEDGDETTPL